MFGGRAVLFLILLSGVAGFFIGISFDNRILEVVPQLEVAVGVPPKAYAGIKPAKEATAVKPYEMTVEIFPPATSVAEDEVTDTVNLPDETGKADDSVGFLLDGLLYDNNGSSSALIRDRQSETADIVKEGETINGYTLSRVGSSSVTLIRGNDFLVIDIKD